MEFVDRVRTAGAYVITDGYFPFMVGPTPDGTRLAIVRLGGHRENGERPWECTKRELLEEARLHIAPLSPPATYVASHAESNQLVLERRVWGDTPQPILILDRGNLSPLSIMYLACSSGRPSPAAETKGLLLLTPEDVWRICDQPATLREYLEWGGRALFQSLLPLDTPLVPFPQLKWLAQILRLHPELIDYDTHR